MALQQVEFEFPDPDKDVEGTVVEVDLGPEEHEVIQVDGAVGRKTVDKSKVVESEEETVTIVDDTPPKDRNRVPSAPPRDVTDDELKNYSESVQQRIKHFSKGYHDERRAKETAERERVAIEQFAKSLIEENKRLKGDYGRSQEALLAQAKKTVEGQIETAKRQYKQAYDTGDSDAIVAAQSALNDAQIRMSKLASFKPQKAEVTDTSLQIPANEVQRQVQVPANSVQRDTKAETWRDNNPWFGSDDEMTAFALGLHNKLVNEGVDPQSDNYYERINTRMRQVFPDQFDDGGNETPEPTPRKRSNVVAPATRSTAPKQYVLSKTQQAIAKRLGVSPVEYAKQVAILERKQNG